MSHFRTIITSLALVLLPDTSSQAVEPQTEAPEFMAVDVDGNPIKLTDLKGKTVVLEWFNFGCPFVRKHYDAGVMPQLQKDYTGKGVVWISINSTAESERDYKNGEDTKTMMKSKSAASSHIVLDKDGKIGALYAAKTTPHMYVIDREGKLVYQGAIDDAPDPASDPKAAKNYVKEALDATLASAPVPLAQTKPYGCSVKYAS